MNSLICETHEGKSLQFYCLDPRCKVTPMCCLLCLKNLHVKCRDDFIVQTGEAATKINLIKNESDPTFITKKLNQVLELKLYEMNKNLMNKKKGFISSFDIQESPENILDPNVLPSVKMNFNFELNKESNLIDISSKFNATEEQVMESIGFFEKDLEKKILNFLNEFTKLKFVIRNSSMNSDDWIGHDSIEITGIPEGVHFKRKETDTQNNYLCCLYTIPLDSPCTFKVNVESVNESDRFVDVGIVTKSKFESIKSGFLNSFSSGGISYCGYSIGGGLEGKYPTGSSDANGMGPGAHFYMRYEPQVEIKFYDNNDKIDLKKSMVGDTEEYYLFAVLYHPQVAYFIERID